MQLSAYKQKIRETFDALAPERRMWRAKNAAYYDAQAAYLRFVVPPGRRVLELGCGTGELLAALEPSLGVGVDLSPRMTELAAEAFPGLTFLTGDAENLAACGVEGTFDFIVVSDLVGHLEDVQACFENLRPFCTPETRVIVGYYNFLWEPLLELAERVGAKMPQRMGNWLSPLDIKNLLYLADFETVKTDRKLLLPRRVPLLSPLAEALGSLPLVNRLCLSDWVVARMRERAEVDDDLSVTVLIPCRNERGNIEPAVRRTPELGSHTEIIFVDGHSQDGTPEEIRRVMAANPDKDIKFLVQDGKGKGDAVRKGFAAASGDVLMILDADLTMPPEDLPKFYRAIASGKGEFINGTRLVYPMQDEAMRFLNLLGNKFFSLAFSWLLNQRLKDTLCGTKVLSRKDYERLVAGRAYFGDFDPFGDFDLLFGASKLNLKIVEVPIRYRAREYGETQISRFRHGLLLLRMCWFAMRKLKFV
ncbi:bifunctional class I SAM-dependent methyltransferase/glycosyltransferase family 2 protein [Desulfocurvus vexinensis]|uniref:bifunctional class I SAM-dependent methyltransferase/glycosyltransferase family 2 protein n=1 Tax=Desulfocurvus vexinensis TaxID=399548 RepID=UPI00048CC1E9|nr:bifunctional class I SAM-dependent methyltransferase/glycosyltransferase family 2 protein [Desulfocurvus vexinensis]